MLSSDQNENYIEVIPCEDDNIEMNSQTTEAVDRASFSNKTQLHSGSESDEQTAYEVPVEMLSSGRNDTFHDVTPSRDDKYEKNTNDPRYQSLELSRQTLYQELYEKMAWKTNGIVVAEPTQNTLWILTFEVLTWGLLYMSF